MGASGKVDAVQAPPLFTTEQKVAILRRHFAFVAHMRNKRDPDAAPWHPRGMAQPSSAPQRTRPSAITRLFVVAALLGTALPAEAGLTVTDPAMNAEVQLDCVDVP